MAQFEGTITEFTKFIGAYARIKVMHIAARHKKSIGKCEDCGSETRTLEAAHVRGKERPLIISNILAEYAEGDTIKIDLEEFEVRFIEAHSPIEKTIKILCKDCHRKYDSTKFVHEFTTQTFDMRNVADNELKEEEENKVIEKMTRGNLNKGKAIEIIYSKLKLRLKSADTTFSNIISIDDVWWLQPNNEKFQHDLNILLHDHKLQMIYLFILPANTIIKPSNHFKQRNDKFRSNCSDIYIPLSRYKFLEKRGFDFTQFLIDKVQY